jgi:CRP/FNR family cyclic AMP-dependent transcriptional regulator
VNTSLTRQPVAVSSIIVGTRPRKFNAWKFLNSAGVGRTIVTYSRGQAIFAQGDIGNSVLYILSGAVKLSVQSRLGQSAVVAIFGPRDFFGEGCLATQRIRNGHATAITASTILAIKKREMVRLLHTKPALSDLFISHMLARNIRIEEDLIDLHFNSIEKRLARLLLLLARSDHPTRSRRVIPDISQGTLAEMVSSTRSRVNVFLNKFRKLGFIDYNGRLKVNKSLRTVLGG